MKKVKFNAKKVTGKAVVNDLAKPVLIGMVGAAAGHFAGKGRNLLVAGIGGLAAIAMGYEKTLAPAIIGCAVVTPSSATTTTTAGLEGIKEIIADGTTRGKGYVKGVLNNIGLSSVANQIAGLDYADPSDAYEQGYISGVNDAALVEDDRFAVDGLSGRPYVLSEGVSTARSMEAALSAGM